MTELPLGPGLAAVLPDWHALGGVLGLAVALAVCLGLGALAIGRDSEPEVQVVGGWGVLCLVLTLWGVTSGTSLRIPLVALAVVAAACFIRPRLRQRIASPSGTLAVAALSIPLWLVMLPAAPSQVDTWLNLLPNAAYLFDHGRFPGRGLAPSFSFLPGAPYNTQFIAFATSVFSGSLAASAMIWFNVVLASVAGIAIARQLVGRGAGARRPLATFSGAAAGLLLAVPLNPGFVPRYDFSPYGEWPLAVLTMLAGLLCARLIECARRGSAIRAHAVSLALVLAALVDTKQSGPGLVLAIWLPLLAIGWRELRGIRRLALPASLLPAVVLYAVWQLHVRSSGAAELGVLPAAAWNFRLIPAILFAMAHEAFKHPGQFALEAVVIAGAARSRWRRQSGFPATLLVVSATTIVLDNGYIFASYVVHSDPVAAANAHSYFRYNTQLSLLVMLALVVWLRPGAERLLAGLSAASRRRLSMGAIAIAVLAPIALWPLLRFDLDAPQPTLAVWGRDLSSHLHAGDRVALVLPGDTDDALGSFLRGQVLFMPPRVAVAAFASYKKRLDATTLRAITAAGFDRIVLTCAPAAITGTAMPSAALLGRAGARWKTLATWRFNAMLFRHHFAALIPHRAFCPSG